MIARLLEHPRDARAAFRIAALIGCFVGLVAAPLLVRFGVNADVDFGGYAHDGYVELAQSLWRGDGFVFEPGGDRVSHRPPLYPLMLVPIVALPEALQRPAMTVVQALLLAAAIASTFRIAERFFGRDTARVATRLLLINPWLYWMTWVAMLPLLQMALLAWLLRALFANGPEGERVSRVSPLAGPLAAGLALTHGAMALTIAFLFGAAGLLALRRGLPALGRVAAASALALACIAPWTVRNWIVFERFIPVASNAGFAYFAGTAHWGQGALSGQFPPQEVWGTPAGEEGLFMVGAGVRYDEAAHFYGLRDIELSDRLDALASEHARADVPRLLRKMALNGLENYFPIVFPLVRNSEPSLWRRALGSPLKLVRSLFYVGFCGLALLGLLRPPAGRGLEVALLAYAAFAYVLPYLPFLTFSGHSMYNFGSLPPLAILGALGWISLRTKREPTSPDPPSSA